MRNLLIVMIVMLAALTSSAQEKVSFRELQNIVKGEREEARTLFTQVTYYYKGHQEILVKTEYPDSVVINRYKMYMEWEQKLIKEGHYTLFTHLVDMNTGKRFNAYTDKENFLLLFDADSERWMNDGIYYTN